MAIISKNQKVCVVSSDIILGKFKMNEIKHFVCTHTFTSDKSSKSFLTPPENRIPPIERLNEKDWALASKGKFATCMQTWVGNDDFFFCHWIAESEDQIYQQLEEWGLQDLLNSLIHPMYRFMSAYRNTDELEQFPQTCDKW